MFYSLENKQTNCIGGNILEILLICCRIISSSIKWKNEIFHFVNISKPLNFYIFSNLFIAVCIRSPENKPSYKYSPKESLWKASVQCLIIVSLWCFDVHYDLSFTSFFNGRRKPIFLKFISGVHLFLFPMHPFSNSWKHQKTVFFQGIRCMGNVWVNEKSR